MIIALVVRVQIISTITLIHPLCPSAISDQTTDLVVNIKETENKAASRNIKLDGSRDLFGRKSDGSIWQVVEGLGVAYKAKSMSKCAHFGIEVSQQHDPAQILRFSTEYSRCNTSLSIVWSFRSRSCVSSVSYGILLPIN
ncbi:hypothetical protein MRB53_024604 [Persea americana]|uniref:Uncharacterized protein n=1 Tax=Persea americana TaxID=3435 RepID=A0ACC2LDK6_PERAE|nr:hypothetical protein MRB53_024604 [Persea americana]